MLHIRCKFLVRLKGLKDVMRNEKKNNSNKTAFRLILAMIKEEKVGLISIEVVNEDDARMEAMIGRHGG